MTSRSDIIISVTARFYRVTVSALLSPCRQRRFVVPRQVAMYLCREIAEMSLPQIGEAIGGRHHTTVMHGVETTAAVMSFDRKFHAQVGRLSRKVRSALGGEEGNDHE